MRIDNYNFSILRSDGGNIFFFILPFININLYYRKTSSSYYHISMGWLIFHFSFYITKIK